MKIIAINGSPRGKSSTTYLMVEEFFKGAQNQGAITEHILLSQMNIHHCVGCLTCWTQTPGACVFRDDMQKINFMNCDLIIYATPLYADNVSGLLKNFIDRSISHRIPGQMPPKIMVIANCGYPGQVQFDALKLLFRRMASHIRTDLIAEIYRDGGPLLQDVKFESIIIKYKQLLQQAGKEIAQNLKISEQTQKELEKALIPQNIHIEMHNEHFEHFKTK